MESNTYKTLKHIAESVIGNDIVSEYIETNDKALVPKILKLIAAVPEYMKLNDEFKASAKTLYRGISLPEVLSENEILEYEKSQEFVATSRSEQVAKDYAKGRSALNGKDGEKPALGVVLTYEVTAEDVIFDIATFDKDYGTLETLINPKTSKLVKYEK